MKKAEKSSFLSGTGLGQRVHAHSPLLGSLLAARSCDGIEVVVSQIMDACSEKGEPTKRSVFQTSGKLGLRERCLDVIKNGNLSEWKLLVDELQGPVEGDLLKWKQRGESAISQSNDEWRKAVVDAVGICLPGFVPLFSAVYLGEKEHLRTSVNILRRLALLGRRMGGGAPNVLNIGWDMLYVAGNIGMAIAVETGQHDFVWDWMLLPMPGFRPGEEMPWAEIRKAFCRFEFKDPFRFLLNIYGSENIRGFFQSEERMKEFLLKANLLQSIIELRLLTRTEKGTGIVEKRDENYKSSVKVLPLWCLIRPDDFQIWTLELFGSGRGLISFFLSDVQGHIDPGRIWNWWKGWKEICVNSCISYRNVRFISIRNC